MIVCIMNGIMCCVQSALYYFVPVLFFLSQIHSLLSHQSLNSGHPELIIPIKEELVLFLFLQSHYITRINPRTGFNYRHILIIKETQDHQ